ncbi:hypothetical protein M501DRAFT_991182 [Patellaria atrata CBS 101060]|uniref:Uncharacterized protein n=1 Tax=Patellaria atrata CBS 101060 TaxID=1346257 RepID=A0A9P4VQR6_9PEZI|nr:hypothetical protein M501DRAFT_991182 [Patellaria atrata CBS 101060]
MAMLMAEKYATSRETDPAWYLECMSWETEQAWRKVIPILWICRSARIEMECLLGQWARRGTRHMPLRGFERFVGDPKRYAGVTEFSVEFFPWACSGHRECIDRDLRKDEKRPYVDNNLWMTVSRWLDAVRMLPKHVTTLVVYNPILVEYL